MNAKVPKILVADDELLNTEIIVEFLADEGYDIATAADGAIAWNMLVEEPSSYDVILLDRMMPHMSGIEVLQKIKADPDLQALPVILQTARAAPDDVVEGIRAGAYYYLAKPYSEDMLRSVVRTAVRDSVQYQILRAELSSTAQTLSLMSQGHFRFRSLTEARALAGLLAQTCPQPRRVVTGLAELFINAIEHGNLGIRYQDKTALNETGTWESEVVRRLALPENQDKFVEVRFDRTEDAIEMVITDQGDGFDWSPYLEFSPERGSHNHGRGIALSKALSFDALNYRGSGNEVQVIVKR